MITHGNKQISEIVYARKASEGGGAVRLTNIIRGAQVVFGGLKPSFAWLEKATKAAILAAFGQTDGKAVIKATNAYLNALAATDKSKASALAGFINEDPMLVCSLGLQPQGVQMPIRWVKTDGSSYIDTGWVANGGMHAYIGFTMKSGNKLYFGSHNTSEQGSTNNYNRNQFDAGTGNIITFNVLNMGGGNAVANKINFGADNNCELSSVTVGNQPFIVINGTRSNITGIRETLAPLNNVRLFYYYWEGVTKSSSGTGFSYCKMFDKDEVAVREMYPFIRQGENGMLDTLTGTFYPNANTSGSFTIAYTLPDGTPWTPINQTT